MTTAEQAKRMLGVAVGDAGVGSRGPYGHWGRRATLHLGLVAAQCDLELGLGGSIGDARYAALTAKVTVPAGNTPHLVHFC